MPLNPSALAPIIAAGLLSAGQSGFQMPKFTLGIASGVCKYFSLAAKVVTVDTGTLGAGTGANPFFLSAPALIQTMLAGYASAGILGMFGPGNATGVANGISQGLISLALLQTNHPSVGVGTGVARIVGSSAVPTMVAGFADAGMVNTGSVQQATGIGIGLDTFFQSFTMPIAIVGSTSPSGSSGSGFGFVV